MKGTLQGGKPLGAPRGPSCSLSQLDTVCLWDGLGQGLLELLELLCWCHEAATAQDTAGRACKDIHGLPKTPKPGAGNPP